MSENISFIPSRLKNASVGGHVAGTVDIIDDNKGKTQDVINQEADAKFSQMDDEIEALVKQDVVPVDTLPSVSEADPKKIYRVVGETSYTDYMVNASGDGWKELAEFSFPGIDDEPTAGSKNLVESGRIEYVHIGSDTNTAYNKSVNAVIRDGHVGISTIDYVGGTHVVLSVNHGDTVYMAKKSNSAAAVISFVKSYDGHTQDFSDATGFTERIELDAETPSGTYTVPNDVRFILVGITNDYGNDIAPSSLCLNNYELMTDLYTKLKALDDEIEQQKEDSIVLQTQAALNVNSQSVIQERDGYITSILTRLGSHKVVSVTPGSSVTVKTREGKLSVVAFSKNGLYNVRDSIVFSDTTGYTDRFVLNNTSMSFTVPNDTPYLLYAIQTDAGVDVTPESIIIDGVDLFQAKNINVGYPFYQSVNSNDTDREALLRAVKDICVKSGRLVYSTRLEVTRYSSGRRLISVIRNNDNSVLASYDSSDTIKETEYVLMTLEEVNHSALSFYILIKFAELTYDKTYVINDFSKSQIGNKDSFSLTGPGTFTNASIFGGTLVKSSTEGQSLILNSGPNRMAVSEGDVVRFSGYLDITGDNAIITLRNQNGQSLLAQFNVPTGHFDYSVPITSGVTNIYVQIQYNTGQSGTISLSNCVTYKNSESIQFSLNDSRFISTMINGGGGESAESNTSRNNRNMLSYISKITKLTSDVQRPTADLNLVMLYGQSLAMAAEATDIMTTENVGGNVFPGSDTVINPSLSGSGFTTLTYNNSTGAYEPTVIHAVNRLKLEMDNKFLNLTAEKKMVAAATGQGGQAIEQMMKSWPFGTVSGTDYTGASAQLNIYKKSFQKVLAFTKAQADAAGKSLVCPVIMFMQGENNANHAWGNNQDGNPQTKSVTWNPSTDVWTEGAAGPPTYDKDTYKAYLLKLKEDMQQDVMTILGQSKKPLFMMYVPGQWHTKDFNVPIQRAFIEAMQENDDMIISAPTYPSPDYGSHLTSNGYRILGEMFGKRLYQAYLEDKKYYPLMAENIEVAGNTITVNIPTLYPLVRDNKTVNVIPNDGFQVKANGSAKNINTVEVHETFVKLICDAELYGNIEVAYANNENEDSGTPDKSIKGHGNIRNTDPFPSIYNWKTDSSISNSGNPITYVPLDAEGVSLEGSGKPYHCYDWLLPFYFAVSV